MNKQTIAKILERLPDNTTHVLLKNGQILDLEAGRRMAVEPANVLKVTPVAKAQVMFSPVSDTVRDYDITQVNDETLYRPGVQADEDYTDDSYADDQSDALAARLGSFSRNDANRYTINLPNGEYRPQMFPDSSFLVQDGEIVGVRGPDAYATVASWSSRQETVVAEQEDVPGIGVKPQRLGNNYVMPAEASGLSDAAPFVRVQPGDTIGGAPIKKAAVRKTRGGLWGDVFRQGDTSENGR